MPMLKKQSPTCCEAALRGVGGVWWDEQEYGPSYGLAPDVIVSRHKPGWTMVKWASIYSRSVAFMNVGFCPHCGTRLPATPPT